MRRVCSNAFPIGSVTEMPVDEAPGAGNSGGGCTARPHHCTITRSLGPSTVGLDSGHRCDQISLDDGCPPADPTNDPIERKTAILALDERQKTKRPRKYHVVFHNDDYTTMEFVVHVLEKFFHKGETEATQIMLEVHHKGYGIVGVFTRDIAESKASR